MLGAQHGACKAHDAKGKREESIPCQPARQLLTPVSPVLGWGRLDRTFILLSECFICPSKWEIGVEGGVWVGGWGEKGGLIQSVGGELAHWVTSTCRCFFFLFFFFKFSPSSSFSLFSPPFPDRGDVLFSSPLDRSGPLPPYISL